MSKTNPLKSQSGRRQLHLLDKVSYTLFKLTTPITKGGS